MILSKRHNISKKGRKEGCPMRSTCDGCNWYRARYKYAENKMDATEIWDCQINHLVEFICQGNQNSVRVQQSVQQVGSIFAEAVEERQQQIHHVTEKLVGHG